MSPTTSQVVVAYDFSRSATEALNRAVALAARAPFHVLHFVCVIEPHQPLSHLALAGPVDYTYAAKVQTELTDKIALELREANVFDRVHFFVHARIGRPAEEILAVAREIGADMILVGSKGTTGVERLLLGSVSERIVREAGCTVEVVRPKTYQHVDLLAVVDVEPHHTYVPPHRYSYENKQLIVRPPNWPLY